MFTMKTDRLLLCNALTVVGINIKSSAEAVAESVKFGAKDLHSNVTGSSTRSTTLKYMTLQVHKCLDSKKYVCVIKVLTQRQGQGRCS